MEESEGVIRAISFPGCSDGERALGDLDVVRFRDSGVVTVAEDVI